MRKRKILVYTLVYAVEADDVMVTGDVNIGTQLEYLREMGMAEVVDIKLVDKPFEDITIADAPGLTTKARLAHAKK